MLISVLTASETDIPFPLPLVLGVLTLISTVVTALITYIWSKRVRTPTDDREDRKLGIEADEKLLERFENMLLARDTRIDGLGKRIEELDIKVEGYRQERNVLLDFIYTLVRIIRELGGVDMIPLPPSGIFISGHPSNRTHMEETPHKEEP